MNSDFLSGWRACVKSRAASVPGVRDAVVGTLCAQRRPLCSPPGTPRACPVRLLRMACRCAQLWSLVRTLPPACNYIPSAEGSAGLGGHPLWYLTSASPFWVLAQGHRAYIRTVVTGGLLSLSCSFTPHVPSETWPPRCCCGDVSSTEHHSCNFPATNPLASCCCLE